MMKKYALAVILLLSSFILTGCAADLLQRVVDAIPEHTDPSYDTLVEHWQNCTVFEGGAAEEAYDILMTAAEEGDRDKFVSCFTPEIQAKSVFQNQVDEFFKAYPKGLKNSEAKFSPAGAGGSFKDGKAIKGAGALYEYDLNGDHYRIHLKFCYVNDADPNKVGMEYFVIQNNGALAKSNYENKGVSEEEMGYLIVRCDIRNDVNYRIIGGDPIYWTDTDSPKLTADEMRALLSEYRNLGTPEVRDAIGEPNYAYKSPNSTGCTIYYELASENGEARYARISAASLTGKVYDAYVCTADSTDYDHPLCEFIRQKN